MSKELKQFYQDCIKKYMTFDKTKEFESIQVMP